jgi:hypothetical protein
MAGKQTEYAHLFGWFTIAFLAACFACIPLSTIIPPHLAYTYFDFFAFLVVPSFIAWLVARSKANKQPQVVQAFAPPAYVPPAPPQSICVEDPNFTESKHNFFVSPNLEVWFYLFLAPQHDYYRTYIVDYAKVLLQSAHFTVTPYKVLMQDFLGPIRAPLSQYVFTLGIPSFNFDLDIVPKGSILIGGTSHDPPTGIIQNEPYLHAIPYEARTRHVYVAGKSQHGKSTMLLQCALFDISKDKGVAVIDPHGDLVESILQSIPPRLADKTIYLDAENAFPIDFMSFSNEREKEALVGDIIFLLQRFPGWGPRMDSILRNILYTLLEAGDTCFLDIYYFLVDENRRKEILSRVNDPDLLRVWSTSFPSRDAIEPIVTRMTTFVRSPSLKTFMSGGENQLNIYDLMQAEKILLVNLVKSGRETGDLLGSLIVSKIQQAAMRRYAIPPEQRRPFYLYTDEFERFQTTSFDIILSEAGKFKLGLVMANQFTDQLDSKILSAVLGNVSTFLLFRMDERDARHFTNSVKTRRLVDLSSDENLIKAIRNERNWEEVPLPADALASLPPGHALYRSADGEATFIEFRITAIPLTHYADYIKQNTLAQYGMKRSVYNAPCNSLSVLHDEGNDDEPQPGGTPSVPIHEDQEG